LTQIIEKNYLVDLLKSVPQIGDVVHYEVRNHLLTVEDPQFVFFLRNIAWDRFAEEVGYLGINFQSRYDFALSFAGSERNIAESIFSNLGEREIEVFYDKNEQHRILAVSPVTSKPAGKGRIKTSHSEVLYSYLVS
jgi:hypothetical protein